MFLFCDKLTKMRQSKVLLANPRIDQDSIKLKNQKLSIIIEKFNSFY